MEKVVYVLGAGFSAPLGLPVMSNFIEKSKDMFFNEGDAYGDFKEIFKIFAELSYLKTYYESDLLNIEEVLSIIETKQITKKMDDKHDNLIDYINKVIKRYTPDFKKPRETRHDLYSGLFMPQDDFTKEKNLYGKFISHLLNIEIHRQVDINKIHFQEVQNSKYCYSAITLNYDKVIETIKACFEEQNRKIGFNTKYDLPDLWNQFSYSKLHGSIDEEIIPPNWNKMIVKEEIKNAWILAYKLLTEANEIRFIGYSLPITDSYVKYLFKAALTEDPTYTHLKKIDVICYDPYKDVEERYRQFIKFKNFRFVDSKFEDILSNLNKKLGYNRTDANICSWINYEKCYNSIIDGLKSLESTNSLRT